MVIIFRERFVPELGMYREYRGTPRTEKITEDAAYARYAHDRIVGSVFKIE